MKLRATRLLIAAVATLVVAVLGLLPGYVPRSSATPIYAARSVHACDTCHIEPAGWANPEMRDRRCSLDCSVCHVSPTGGGMRTSSGLFYGTQMLPTWGPRPSDHTEDDKYLPDGHPGQGRYRSGEGFSGWWPGELDSTELEDRYGSITPDPAVRTGGDFRVMQYTPIGASYGPMLFPMQAELYLAARPQRKKTVIYADAGLKSSRSGLNILGSELEGPVADAVDYFRVREAFVMVDRLPYKSYVRAGRFNPAYGLRIPDHTSFVRRALGFDQDRQVFGLEGGINPNYPYANVAVFREGIEAWPGDTGAPGWGVGATGGVRELGWHAGGSIMTVFEDDGATELTLGPQYTLNLYPLVVLGEVDLQHRTLDGEASQKLFVYQEFNYLISRGVSAKLKLDWRDDGLDSEQNSATRLTLGGEWHPWTRFHLEAQYLHQYQYISDDTGDVALGLFARSSVLMLHGWF